MFYFKLKDCVDFETLKRYGFHFAGDFYIINNNDYFFGVDIDTRILVLSSTPTKYMFLDVFYKLVNDGLIEMIEK